MQRSFIMLLVAVVAIGTLLAACSKAPAPEGKSASESVTATGSQAAEASGGAILLTLDVQDMV